MSRLRLPTRSSLTRRPDATAEAPASKPAGAFPLMAPSVARAVTTVGGALLLLVIAFGLVIGGCGLRPDEQPQLIPRERLDDRLFHEEGSDTRAGGGPGIYVLSNQGEEPRLYRVDVPVPPGASTERTARVLLEALLAWAPPSDGGGNARLRSLIPNGATLEDVHLDGDTLTVDLSNVKVEGPGQAQALAQLVYTATETDPIAYVRFTVDGKPVAVPLASGNTEPGAKLRRSDFDVYDPGSATTQPAQSVPPAPAAPAPSTPPTTPAVTPTSVAAAVGDQPVTNAQQASPAEVSPPTTAAPVASPPGRGVLPDVDVTRGRRGNPSTLPRALH
jgi:hypothetical protein